jgi:hypothetical protein
LCVNGKTAFQADDEGSIPFTRSSLRPPKRFGWRASLTRRLPAEASAEASIGEP